MVVAETLADGMALQAKFQDTEFGTEVTFIITGHGQLLASFPVPRPAFVACSTVKGGGPGTSSHVSMT